jgi:hypothetical protein
MQPISFPGAIEIKKPPSMTDEECMSTWALIHVNDKQEVTHFTQCWKPSYEDLQALNRGEGVYIQIMYPRLPPIAVFTIDENGNANDAG